MIPYPPLTLGFQDDRLAPESVAYAIVYTPTNAPEALHSLRQSRNEAEAFVREWEEHGEGGWQVEAWPTPRGLLEMLRTRFPAALPMLDRADAEARRWLGLPPASCRVPSRYEVERAEALVKTREGRLRNIANRTVDLPQGKERNAYALKRRREGATYKAIAREVGISPGNVRTMLWRAEQQEARANKIASWDQRAARLPDLDLKAIPGPETRVEHWTQDWTPERQHDELRRER